MSDLFSLLVIALFRFTLMPSPSFFLDFWIARLCVEKPLEVKVWLTAKHSLTNARYLADNTTEVYSHTFNGSAWTNRSSYVRPGFKIQSYANLGRKREHVRYREIY